MPNSIPCPAHCENGYVLGWSSGPYHATATAPREEYARCEVCDGDGELDSFECGRCSKTFCVSDELPGRLDEDGTAECRGCIREEALEDFCFAPLAELLGKAVDVLGGIICSRDPMRAAYSIGAARGQVADVERALRDLAKALGETAR
jgi:hypothetical protein